MMPPSTNTVVAARYVALSRRKLDDPGDLCGICHPPERNRGIEFPHLLRDRPWSIG